eukprot:5408272-Prymnesium_polylepis.1
MRGRITRHRRYAQSVRYSCEALPDARWRGDRAGGGCKGSDVYSVRAACAGSSNSWEAGTWVFGNNLICGCPIWDLPFVPA